ncbi:MAG: hypothetical protein KDJ75_01990 [Alphaproteobacteria bacterium]|nr:hypothetical protein [Alphaproteobacteria bacterium]
MKQGVARIALAALTLQFALFVFAPAAFAQEIVLGTLCQDDIDALIAKGVEYQPGVDVNGNAVAPADLNQSVKILSYPVEIPVEISLIKWMNLNVDPALRLDPEVGHFELQKDGRITYNGQDISDRVHLCEKGHDTDTALPEERPSVRTEDVVPRDTKESGQAVPDRISSPPPAPELPKTPESLGEMIKGEAE